MKDLDLLSIGARIRSLRTTPSVALTVTELAERIGVSQPMIYACEKGRRTLPVYAAIHLCDMTGATLDYIYRGVPDALPKSLRISLNEVSADELSEINAAPKK
mgnify:CR=1 FL=1